MSIESISCTRCGGSKFISFCKTCGDLQANDEAIMREERNRASRIVLERAHDFSSGEYYSRMKIITALHDLAAIIRAESENERNNHE